MRSVTRLICPLVIVAASATARADDPATAKDHIDEGTKLYNLQHYEEALAEYQAGYLLDPRPEYLYAIAQAQRLSGDCTKAVQTYRAYLRSEPTADQRVQAEKNIDRCAPHPVQTKISQPQLATERQNADTEMPGGQPAARPTRSFLVGHILVGVGVAAIGGGAYFYRKGHSAIESHNTAQTYDEFAALDAGDARRQQTLGVSTLAAGSCLVVGGVLYYVWRARAPVQTSVSAQVGADGTMVTVGRSF